MATDMGSPPRFFHMPRFQHQAPRQLFYKRPDFAQQQAMQQLTFDGKRMRKAVNRKTIDYNPSVIRYLENRLWQRDHRDFRAIQPDSGCYNDLVPPVGMLNNPMNAVTTKFVRTSTNKVKCPVFVVRWTPEGRRLVTGASSGEFTLWNGLTFNFETILQAHDSPVRAMTWSHNDMWMLTADHGGYVKYWQSNMNNVKMFQAHKEAIREARSIPNLTFSVVGPQVLFPEGCVGHNPCCGGLNSQNHAVHRDCHFSALVRKPEACQVAYFSVSKALVFSTS
uniref:WD repeat domain 33 n=1 Tax=Scleropages formosus TaxID=113540 RepID=A0A8C9WPS4_SCLFO